MKENISSPELTLNIWSNDACRGYVIMAMQDCGFTHKDISRVVNQLYGVFDLYTLNEAEQKYITAIISFGPTWPEAGESSKGSSFQGAAFLGFPSRQEGSWPLFIRTEKWRFSMVQSVTYQSEKQSVYFQGKLIVLENLIPVLSPDEKNKRKREIENHLYDVFSKYTDRFY